MLVAFANQKGGVGKSSLSVHLAVWLKEQGRSVALIDSDAEQESSSQWLADMGSPLSVVKLFTAEDVFARADELCRKYEIVVADGPAGMTPVTRALCWKADLVVLSVGPGILDFRSALRALDVLREARKGRKAGGLPRAVLAPNRLQPNTVLSRELLQAADQLAGVPVLPPLRLRQAIADAPGQGTVVWRLGSRAAESSAEMLTLLKTLYETYIAHR
jgi:chromosome partitioning protein